MTCARGPTHTHVQRVYALREQTYKRQRGKDVLLQAHESSDESEVSIEPWRVRWGAFGDMHVQQITQPATRGAFSFENPTRPHEFDPKEIVPVVTKCDAKRTEFKEMLKEKARRKSTFASYWNQRRTSNTCGLPESGTLGGNEGCRSQDRSTADDVFCALLEGERAEPCVACPRMCPYRKINAPRDHARKAFVPHHEKNVERVEGWR